MKKDQASGASPGFRGDEIEQDSSNGHAYFERIVKQGHSAFLENLTNSDARIIATKLYTMGKITDDGVIEIRSRHTRALLDIVVENECCDTLFEIMEEHNSSLKHLAIGIKEAANAKSYDFEVAFAQMSLGLSPRHRAVIKLRLDMLEECENVQDIIDNLFSEMVISDREKEVIVDHKLDCDRMQCLILEHILKRSIKEFDKFLDILTKCDKPKADLVRKDFIEMGEDKVAELTAIDNIQRIKNARQFRIISAKKGSIILDIEIEDYLELLKLQRSFDKGELEADFLEWLESSGCARNLTDIQIDANYKFYNAAPLESKIIYKAICMEDGRISWFWSIDGLHWCHLTRIVWPIGNQKGRILKRKDRENHRTLLLQEIRGMHVNCDEKRDLLDKRYHYGHSLEEIDVSLVVTVFKMNEHTETDDLSSWVVMRSPQVSNGYGLLRDLTHATWYREKYINMDDTRTLVEPSLNFIHGQLYCCMHDNVVIFDLDLNEVRRFRYEITGISQVSEIEGEQDVVAAATNGLYIVDDKGNIKVQLSNVKYDSVKSYKERIYAGNYEERTIDVFEKRDDWFFIRKFDLPVSKQDEIAPKFLTIAISHDRLYVGDTDQNVVFELTHEGEYKGKHGKKGDSNPGELGWTQISHEDEEGSILINDKTNQCQHVLRSDHAWFRVDICPHVVIPRGVIFTPGALYIFGKDPLISKYVSDPVNKDELVNLVKTSTADSIDCHKQGRLDVENNMCVTS